MRRKKFLSYPVRTAICGIVSIIFVAILSVAPAFAEGAAVDCVNTGDPCLIKNENDVNARNFCATKAEELLDNEYDPNNGTADKEGVRIAISNSCFVGYTNGLNRTAPEKVVAICDGTTLTNAKQRIKTDFPKICKDAYESAGGGSLAGVNAESTCNKKAENSKRFLTMPAWYRGVLDDNCSASIAAVNNDLVVFIMVVAINITEIMLNLVAYASVIFIVVGGYRMIVSAGDSAGFASGRKTIRNAIIGLVISIASIGIVNLVV